MNEEEKKAIEILKELKNNEYGELLNCWDQGDEAKESINVVLNLIQKQEKVIDMLIPYVLNRDISEDYCDKVEDEYCNKVGIGHCYECIKQYFYRKVNKENE